MPIRIETYAQYDHHALGHELEKIYSAEPHCPEVSGDPSQYFQHAMANSGSDLIAARFNSKIIAAALIDCAHAPELMIHNLCVHPATRQRRVGSQLLDAIIQWCSTSQGQPYRLQCRIEDNNKTAIAFFRHHGFTQGDDGPLYSMAINPAQNP